MRVISLLASALLLFLALSCDFGFPQEIIITDPPLSGAVDASVQLPFSYNGTVYQGIMTEPDHGGFEADAFFMLQGTVTASDPAYQYALVRVEHETSGNKTYYWVRGNFIERIWLRFGMGKYAVDVLNVQINDGNLDYDGDILGWTYYTPPVMSFAITNVRDEDGTFFYPSDPVQSDDPAIAAKALQIISDAGTEEEKIRALHDWVVINLYYDFDSLADGRRQKQDALTTLENGFAVCEGYTSLYNAFLRSLGIRAQCIYGLGNGSDHAWSKLDTSSQWLNVDTTWDDPLWEGTSDWLDGRNLQTPYLYFLKTDGLDFPNHTPLDDRIDRGLALQPADDTSPELHATWKGYPGGTY